MSVEWNEDIFIPIPNNIIDLSVLTNPWVLPLYTYIAMNKNIMGEVDLSVKQVQYRFFTPMNRMSERQNKINILKALFLLTSCISTKKGKVLLNNPIDIVGFENFSGEELIASTKVNENTFENFFSNIFGDIDKKEFDEILKSYFTIKVNYNLKSGGFTKCTPSEYVFFLNYFHNIMGKDNKNRTTGFELMSAYFMVKKNVLRNKNFNKMPTSLYDAPEILSEQLLAKKCGFTKIKTNSVIKELLKYNLLSSFEENNEDKTKTTMFLSLPTLKNKTNESEIKP